MIVSKPIERAQPRRRIWRHARPIALLIMAAAVAGCADTLSSLRSPPTMSPMSAPKNPIDPQVSNEANAAEIGRMDPFESARLRRAAAAHLDVSAQSASLVRAPSNSASASLWSSGPQSLFDDRRARTVGDIVTILIEIDDEATINNSTTRTRSGSESLDIPDVLGLDQFADNIFPGTQVLNPAVALESSSATTGDGAVTRDEEINLRIAATVVDVLPNGHLVVTGSQEVRVNFELRDLQVAGVIRPEDISRKNTITYDKIASARISYGGRGIVSDLQRPRYGQQFFDNVSPF